MDRAQSVVVRRVAITVTEKESSVHIRNHRDWRGLCRAMEIIVIGLKGSWLKVPSRVARIWRMGGGCLLKVRDQTMFKEHYTRRSKRI